MIKSIRRAVDPICMLLSQFRSQFLSPCEHVWSYQDGRADAIGRIAEPIVCCGSACDEKAEAILFYEVERVRIADTIGRIAETIVLCGPERDGRAETIVFYEVERDVVRRQLPKS